MARDHLPHICVKVAHRGRQFAMLEEQRGHLF